MAYNHDELMKDFFKRTFKILDQYNKLKYGEKEYYNVTLLINCLFGIVIMPKSHWHRKINDNKFISNNDNIVVEIGGKKGTLENYNIGFIMNSLRNSLAHWGDTRKGQNNGEENIQFISSTGNITEIIFKNKQSQFKMHFKTIESLRSFLEEFKSIIID